MTSDRAAIEPTGEARLLSRMVAIAVLALACFTVSSCGRGSATNPPLTPASPSHGNWAPGFHYQVIDTAAPASATVGRIANDSASDVIEFFRYDCGHCNRLEPSLEEWALSHKASITLTRVPVVWGSTGLAYARLFFTLMKLNRLDLHKAVFAEIHTKHAVLYADDDAKTLELQEDFARRNGIDVASFRTAYRSDLVLAQLAQAKALAAAYQVEGVPAFVVHGRYQTDIGKTDGDSDLFFQLVDYLLTLPPEGPVRDSRGT